MLQTGDARWAGWAEEKVVSRAGDAELEGGWGKMGPIGLLLASMDDVRRSDTE